MADYLPQMTFLQPFERMEQGVFCPYSPSVTLLGRQPRVACFQNICRKVISGSKPTFITSLN